MAGQLLGDVWAPVLDYSNEWIQIGTDHPLCALHMEVYNQLPAWGEMNGCCNNNEILCCDEGIFFVVLVFR